MNTLQYFKNSSEELLDFTGYYLKLLLKLLIANISVANFVINGYSMKIYLGDYYV